jgi:BirA family biotin operon repressor/biotin-[acetyl-CoA-carboxylase] ligase
MNLDQLQALLGFDFEYFDVIDSTSLYLSRCIKQAKNPPRLVIASEQTNGQGRIGKKFFSPPNTGLYLTFCFGENQIQNSDLTPRLAVAVCEAIFDVFSISCGIKWVNDLYLNGRKVCGVLC